MYMSHIVSINVVCSVCCRSCRLPKRLCVTTGGDTWDEYGCCNIAPRGHQRVQLYAMVEFATGTHWWKEYDFNAAAVRLSCAGQ